MRKDGVYRWHLSRAVPVLNHNGAILKWVGVTIDIGNDLACIIPFFCEAVQGYDCRLDTFCLLTQYIPFLDDLYLAQKAELRKKSSFLANMSHELRT